jgi:hypothetical protein
MYLRHIVLHAVPPLPVQTWSRVLRNIWFSATVVSTWTQKKRWPKVFSSCPDLWYVSILLKYRTLRPLYILSFLLLWQVSRKVYIARSPKAGREMLYPCLDVAHVTQLLLLRLICPATSFDIAWCRARLSSVSCCWCCSSDGNKASILYVLKFLSGLPVISKIDLGFKGYDKIGAAG